jgi:hypothetical protein
MSDSRLLETRGIKRDPLVALFIFALLLTIFLSSPVRQVTDSQYSMMLSQSLLYRASFRLDHYALPRYEPEWYGYYFRSGPYQLEASRGHVYYHLPPGSSVLSAPFVAVLNLLGFSATYSDGTYNYRGEAAIQAILAALLMAALGTLFFYTARVNTANSLEHHYGARRCARNASLQHRVARFVVSYMGDFVAGNNRFSVIQI